MYSIERTCSIHKMLKGQTEAHCLGGDYLIVCFPAIFYALSSQFSELSPEPMVQYYGCLVVLILAQAMLSPSVFFYFTSFTK